MTHHRHGQASGLRGETRMTEIERAFSLAGGGMLTLWALRRGGLFASVAAMAAGALVGAALKRRWPAELVALGDAGGRSGVGRAEEQQIAERRGWKDSAALKRSIVIHRGRQEIYDFWRDFSNLGHFMEHVERVDVLDDKRSRWTVHAPAGQSVSWIARVTEDRPGERIAWESDEGGDIRNEGWVGFEDADDGATKVEAFIAYEPPGGQIGRTLARIFGEEPTVQSAEDLQRLKTLLENGSDKPVANGAKRGRAAPHLG